MININEIQNKILKELVKGIALTRDEIVKRVRIPRTTLFDNLSKLREKKYVFNYKNYTHLKGRPKVYWYIPVRILKIINNKNFYNN